MLFLLQNIRLAGEHKDQISGISVIQVTNFYYYLSNPRRALRSGTSLQKLFHLKFTRNKYSNLNYVRFPRGDEWHAISTSRPRKPCVKRHADTFVANLQTWRFVWNISIYQYIHDISKIIFNRSLPSKQITETAKTLLLITVSNLVDMKTSNWLFYLPMISIESIPLFSTNL